MTECSNTRRRLFHALNSHAAAAKQMCNLHVLCSSRQTSHARRDIWTSQHPMPAHRTVSAQPRGCAVGTRGKYKPAPKLLQACKATQQLEEVQNLLQSSIRPQALRGDPPCKKFRRPPSEWQLGRP